MRVQDIAKFGKLLVQFLARFAGCFPRIEGRLLLQLYVAFGRWPIEDCFREAKEELGLDHFECRGWRCIHRHLYVTIHSQLFCARVRQKLSAHENVLSGERVTMEQVRRAANVYIQSLGLPRPCQYRIYQDEIDRQSYYKQRNAIAAKSHQKTRLRRLLELGIDPNRIKSVPPKSPPC